MKRLFIAEKPSVAQQFAQVLHVNARKNGYLESDEYIVTWCVGHLVTMSYPDAYDPSLKKWAYDTIPFVPDEFKYEVINNVKKQFDIVCSLLNREDVSTIYVCTDSGREGEYIYRLVDQMANVGDKKEKRRVWIDSQTEEEIKRGIKEAKLLSEYDNLSSAAYLRAQEDYLMGINFSRALSLKYSYSIRQYLGLDKCVIAVGRVMSCVLGMIVRREWEIRKFEPTPFFRVTASLGKKPEEADNSTLFHAEWKAVAGSKYENSPKLYKENGFKEKKDAEELITYLENPLPVTMKVLSVNRKTEKKNPPMLYNLAELQNECSKKFKIDPSQTLQIVQSLYEKKLVTYPRTDARVLSTAVAKVINQNIKGLASYAPLAIYVNYILKEKTYEGVAKTKYVNDKAITDHYAIIPTGQGLGQLQNLPNLERGVYDLIARRFIGIFCPPAEYQKMTLVLERHGEQFTANFKELAKPGFLKVVDPKAAESRTENDTDDKTDDKGDGAAKNADQPADGVEPEEKMASPQEAVEYLSRLRKGSTLSVNGFHIKEGKTQSPKRYTSGSMILAMENAGQLIEDDELREQIKGSGIGTSATRDAIITKLVTNTYINLNKKTQVLTPTFLGEIIYVVLFYSIKGMLSPRLTASWEKGLNMVAEGSITSDEYTKKMDDFVVQNTNKVKGLHNADSLVRFYQQIAPYYKDAKAAKKQKADAE